MSRLYQSYYSFITTLAPGVCWEDPRGLASWEELTALRPTLGVQWASLVLWVLQDLRWLEAEEWGGGGGHSFPKLLTVLFAFSLF